MDVFEPSVQFVRIQSSVNWTKALNIENHNFHHFPYGNSKLHTTRYRWLITFEFHFQSYFILFNSACSAYKQHACMSEKRNWFFYCIVNLKYWIFLSKLNRVMIVRCCNKFKLARFTKYSEKKLCISSVIMLVSWIQGMLSCLFPSPERKAFNKKYVGKKSKLNGW